MARSQICSLFARCIVLCLIFIISLASPGMGRLSIPKPTGSEAGNYVARAASRPSPPMYVPRKPSPPAHHCKRLRLQSWPSNGCIRTPPSATP